LDLSSKASAPVVSLSEFLEAPHPVAGIGFGSMQTEDAPALRGIVKPVGMLPFD
jgi:hypothetical protein